MRDLRQASDINCTVFYRLLCYLITIVLICRGHLCVFRVVSFLSFCRSFEVADNVFLMRVTILLRRAM